MLTESYQARHIDHLGIHSTEGWRLKVYSIRHQDKALNPDLIEAAKDSALSFLPQPATSPHHYGLGFISVHQGKSYDFVTVAFWNYDTELKHQSYMRASSSSVALEPITAELSTDVWDLRVLAFERDAWLNTILKPERPDVTAYLNTQLNETT